MADTSSPNNQQLDEVTILIQQAESDPNVPTIYVNKVALSGNETDVSIVFKRGTEDSVVAVVYLAPGLAKVLSEALLQLVKKVESGLGYEFKIPQNFNIQRT